MVKLFIQKGDKSLKKEYLLEILARNYGKNYEINDIKKNGFGKYYIENGPEFSFTHVGEYLITAVSDSPVGIDAEEIKTVFKPVTIFGVAASSAKEYAALYTKAEAVIKYMADKKAIDLKDVDLSSSPLVLSETLDANVFTFVKGDYVLSVVTKDTFVETESEEEND